MKIGFVGVGKMGEGIARNLSRASFSVVAYDKVPSNLERVAKEGVTACSSVGELIGFLTVPRILFLCVPAGSGIDELLTEIGPQLVPGDTVIDLGNSFYKDSQRRASLLKKSGVFLVDVGMSGGIDGAREGACLMIGGNAQKVSELSPIFDAISKNQSYRYLGESGAGHLVKGYHNLVEYGYLQSLAEGLDSLDKISQQEGFGFSLKDVCAIWSRGSIVESRILTDAHKAFEKHSSLESFSGSLHGETLGEMKKLVEIAETAGVPLYCSKGAVSAREDSQIRPSQSARIINAIRSVFGGHLR